VFSFERLDVPFEVPDQIFHSRELIAGLPVFDVLVVPFRMMIVVQNGRGFLSRRDIRQPLSDPVWILLVHWDFPYLQLLNPLGLIDDLGRANELCFSMWHSIP
jgi:hypothetical protein